MNALFKTPALYLTCAIFLGLFVAEPELLDAFAGLLISFAILSVPLYPAWKELKQPQDAKSLAVPRGNLADPSNDIAEWLPQFWDGADTAPPAGVSVLPSETTHLSKASTPAADHWVHRGVALFLDAPAQAKILHAKKLFVEASTPAWLHAKEIAQLKEGVTLQRVQAPSILTGFSTPRNTGDSHARAAQPTTAKSLDATVDSTGSRWGLRKPTVVASRSKVVADLVAQKDLRIGAGSVILGGIKGYETVYLEPDTWVLGNIVARNIHIAQHCYVGGAVLAEEHLTIAERCCFGDPERPTTISADTVDIQAHSEVYGALLSRNRISVLPVNS